MYAMITYPARKRGPAFVCGTKCTSVSFASLSSSVALRQKLGTSGGAIQSVIGPSHRQLPCSVTTEELASNAGNKAEVRMRSQTAKESRTQDYQTPD